MLALVLTFQSELAGLLRSELIAGLQHHYTPGGGLAHTWDRIQRQVRGPGAKLRQPRGASRLIHGCWL